MPERPALRPIVVGVGDLKATNDAESYLTTYALGTSIAVGFYDPGARVAALLHFMLPDSSAHGERAAQCPALFADTGLPALLEAVRAAGAEKSRLKVRLVGGAQVLAGTGASNIGKRNYMAARKALWKLGLMVDGESVGGVSPRSLALPVATGEFWVRTPRRDNVSLI